MAQIQDAAVLPRGLLVALGEDGVELIEAPATRHRFDCSASALAVAYDGSRAIAVGSAQAQDRQLYRLDLARRRVEPWCRATFRRGARTFQGPLWYVSVPGADGNSFQVLGVRHEADDFSIAARSPPPEGDPTPLALRLCGDQLYVDADDWQPLYLTFQLPSLRLVAYGQLVIRDGDRVDRLLALARFGAVPPVADELVFLCKSPPSASGAYLTGRGGTWKVALPGHALAFDAAGPWAAVVLWVGNRRTVQCFRIGEHFPRWMFTFAAAMPQYDPSVDEQNPITPVSTLAFRGGLWLERQKLVAWDARGEVVAFDLARHELIANARF